MFLFGLWPVRRHRLLQRSVSAARRAVLSLWHGAAPGGIDRATEFVSPTDILR